MNILHSLCVRCGFLVIPAITRLGNVQSFKTYMFRFWAYVCIKLRATVACGGDVSENTFAFQSIKVTESNLTPSFLYIPGLCVSWWILCHQVKGNLQVNGSFRVGLMSVICMTIYKCTNNNNISKAYSRLRDMWVNSYENDYNAYEFLTFGAKKAGKDILITAVFCLTLIFAEIFFLYSCNNQLALRAFVVPWVGL